MDEISSEKQGGFTEGTYAWAVGDQAQGGLEIPDSRMVCRWGGAKGARDLQISGGVRLKR